MPFEPQKFISMQNQNLAEAIKELKTGQKTGHWIWYIFPQLKVLGVSDKAKHYGIEDLSEACAYLKNPVLFQNYFDAIEIVHDKLEMGIPATTLMASQVDATKLKSSVTLFNIALTHLIRNADYRQGHYLALQSYCIGILQKLGDNCSETITFISLSKTDILASKAEDDALKTRLSLYIKTRGNEWTYHYNFLGLLAFFYWLKDALTGSNDLKIKSKETKISAANKMLYQLDSQLIPEEQAALNEGRLSKIMHPK